MRSNQLSYPAIVCVSLFCFDDAKVDTFSESPNYFCNFFQNIFLGTEYQRCISINGSIREAEKTAASDRQKKKADAALQMEDAGGASGIIFETFLCKKTFRKRYFFYTFADIWQPKHS
ncbi:MAG: hypothetical protein MJZ66_04150 [Bacteroidales bacterium]|nr:hypothetical protein [Bacteroidales bacterium]